MSQALRVLTLLLLAAPARCAELKFVDTPEELVPMPVTGDLQPLEPRQKEEEEEGPRPVPKPRFRALPSLSSFQEKRQVKYYGAGAGHAGAVGPAPVLSPAGASAVSLPQAMVNAVITAIAAPPRDSSRRQGAAARERLGRDGTMRGLRSPMRLNNGRVTAPLPLKDLRGASRTEQAEDSPGSPPADQ